MLNSLILETSQSCRLRAVLIALILQSDTIIIIKRKHIKTLELIYKRPVSANIKWRDIEALFIELGAEVEEREGSRICVRLFAERRVFHRPHPSPDTDKGAVVSVREWLKANEVKP